jgi:cystathionine beta-lyase
MARVVSIFRYAIVFGPSKAFNLAGLRSALAVVPDAHLRGALARELQRVNEDFGTGIMASAATTAAYSTGDDWLDALTQYVARNLDALIAGLAAVEGLHVIRPDASFLVWIDVSAVGRPDAEVTAQLSRNGVIVEPGTSFGPDGAGFIRVNIGTARSRVEEAAVRIASALGARNRRTATA